MKEDFLHYVWKFQKFDVGEFYTSTNENLHIQKQGSHNLNSGPDFFNAQIDLDGQLWAGNVEIHLKSSDWYAHGHETDAAYDNVILHVVWEHDAEIYRKDGTAIPTFVIKEHIPKTTVAQYQKLFSQEKKWIKCESDFADVDDFSIENWLERLYFERLQKKETFFLMELKDSQNHWESLLFRMLCKNFGLKVNGDSFFSIAKSIDFSVVKKCCQERQDLEALLMGQAGLLEGETEDWYFKTLKLKYEYLKHKFQLQNENVIVPKFFRLRPPNFPTVRLAQFAMLYFQRNNLFSQVIDIKSVSGFHELFNVYGSEYWSTHYNFGIGSLERKKRVTKSFVDLLIINTVIPLKFCYATQHGRDVSEEILKLASEVSSEENTIVKKFNSLKNISKNAYQSQALLQLKSEYCDKNKCLQCAIGNIIIGSEGTASMRKLI
ncbi:DUF2851 family protein [Aequorivita lipolytica]|uniref:DUF2851 family protein n=1 Tax=Aequorivita lipolytica TaxID=153267 RepID=A0A5C6YPU1_9FLAO|nr:DUF2851 family protein [Aequorivita lipolytica]TXD69026.1 DUF2851 family protein [Aequorivita lipolytica]SRX52913.1 hypothetical protein AEQU2_02217 [Aequorivita lipolytica]